MWINRHCNSREKRWLGKCKCVRSDFLLTSQNAFKLRVRKRLVTQRPQRLFPRQLPNASKLHANKLCWAASERSRGNKPNNWHSIVPDYNTRRAAAVGQGVQGQVCFLRRETYSNCAQSVNLTGTGQKSILQD